MRQEREERSEIANDRLGKKTRLGFRSFPSSHRTEICLLSGQEAKAVWDEEEGSRQE